jgi:Rrf2 family protein
MVTRGNQDVGAWRVLSQTAEYALRAVLYMAGRQEATAVPVAEMAGALAVPEKYLARVLAALRKNGTLRSTRGARGGFRLARPAGSVTLLEVVAPFEPVGEARPCLLRGRACGSGGRCSAHDVWQGVGAGVRGFFERTTVADMLPDEHVPAPVLYCTHGTEMTE